MNNQGVNHHDPTDGLQPLGETSLYAIERAAKSTMLMLIQNQNQQPYGLYSYFVMRGMGFAINFIDPDGRVHKQDYMEKKRFMSNEELLVMLQLRMAVEEYQMATYGRIIGYFI